MMTPDGLHLELLEAYGVHDGEWAWAQLNWNPNTQLFGDRQYASQADVF